MVADPPAAIITVTVSIYWLCVGFMIVRARRRTHDLSGLMPEKSFERAMWLVLVPVIVAWIVLPWMSLTHTNPALAVPDIALTEPVYAGPRWAAATGGVLCLVLTIQCWARMGKDWRMDVSEKRKGTLITDGLFAYVRHPIYALSMLLMLCSAIIIATPLMLGIWAVHLVLNNLKARNEERHLLATHGEPYAQYLRRTGRFFPRFAAQTS